MTQLSTSSIVVQRARAWTAERNTTSRPDDGPGRVVLRYQNGKAEVRRPS
jgi:hypothetical protein